MSNNLKVLWVLLILGGGLALWVSMPKDVMNDDFKPQPLIIEWQGELSKPNAFDQILISKSGKSLKLTKEGDFWVLNDGFFANNVPISDLIQGLQQAHIIEAKTANPDNHAKLEVSENDLKVEIYRDEVSVHSIHLGKTSTSGTQFIRRSGEDQTYLVNNTNQVVFTEAEWQLKNIIDINSAEIESIHIHQTTGGDVLIQRNTENGQFELLNMPNAHQLIEGADLNQPANGLSRFTIEEAVPKDQVDSPSVLTLQYKLLNQQSIELKIYQFNDTYMAEVDSALFPQYQDWLFEIADYKFKALNKGVSDFIEPVIKNDSEVKLNQ